MTRITELEQEIRELINAPRKHRAILEDSAEYHKLCSCLDVIGDTELAFRAHEEMSDDPRPGSSYLLVYGFLQALVLQQTAMPRSRGSSSGLRRRPTRCPPGCLAQFRDLLEHAGTDVIRLPYRSPNLNAYVERVILSV